MASRRNFKKDINFLTNEILTRGIIHLNFFGREKSEELYMVMNEAAASRNEYIARVNQKSSGKSAKEIKTHYKSIYDDLLNSTYDLLGKIDNLDN
ncbi:hypothetical protein BZG02_14920 [Labilibaculum filiforme]|uniref:Four helix bundle protein n=1 Tax=Labilibaculum filiforme TaxID=1940526 RepID=A0A2N3HUH3_9BACT|nr:hypothetical protein [Labilibaculum filiforme]PKQ61714.1 hypothetical protein BZG02_14920 [Labilibaculum filiforme]